MRPSSTARFASAFFDAVTDWLAAFAPLAAGAPYVANYLGYTDDRIARLEDLWKGYKAHREGMQRVLDDLQMCRNGLLEERAIPAELIARKKEIERAVVELSAKDEPTDKVVAHQATMFARRQYPPATRWYARPGD